MATGGWKTAEVFRRYSIVSASDQREAVTLLEAARQRFRVIGPVSVPFLAEEEKQPGAKVHEPLAFHALNTRARMAKSADAADLKSAGRKAVGVQVPLWAPSKQRV
jgi:hypothetical protein